MVHTIPIGDSEQVMVLTMGRSNRSPDATGPGGVSPDVSDDRGLHSSFKTSN